ncbi:MAG: efflux RND transporter permease subunit [Planctomycetes bacterium]|nr:efflux RND transporter permease subunit [Planctomycetota bacterium]
MFRTAINNGEVVAVAALVVTVLGLVSIFRVPIQMIPDMDMTTLTVETAWPGATPQDVEREIIVEQEEFLRTLPNLQKMTSLANTGMAVVELEFALGTAPGVCHGQSLVVPHAPNIQVQEAHASNEQG